MSGARKLQSKFVGFLFYLCVGEGGERRTNFWGIEKKINILSVGGGLDRLGWIVLYFHYLYV